MKEWKSTRPNGAVSYFKDYCHKFHNKEWYINKLRTILLGNIYWYARGFVYPFPRLFTRTYRQNSWPLEHITTYTARRTANQTQICASVKKTMEKTTYRSGRSHIKRVAMRRPGSLDFNIILASAQETLTLLLANNKGTDQHAYPRSLISAFIIHYLKTVVTLV